MGEVADEKGGGAPCLQLPEQVTLAQRSSGGPFGRFILNARCANVPLVNGTAATATVARVFLSPLADARTGLAPRPAKAALSATVDKATLDPGEATLIQITGTVPARAGTYISQLYVTTEAGETVLAPVSVTVAASPGWGIACMGLLGVLKLLTGAGDVQDKRREVFRARAEINAWLLRDPPPQRQADAVAEIDRDLDEAVRVLAQPHPLSVADRRIQDADAVLSAAHTAAAKLRDAQWKARPGSAEVADVAEEWHGLQDRMRGLVTLDIQAAVPTAGLAGHAAVLLRRAWDRIVGLPLQWIAADLGPELERVRLVQDAGETERARAMALATRAWLRRAAADLDRRLALMMELNLSDAGMVVSDAWVRHLAAATNFRRRSAPPCSTGSPPPMPASPQATRWRTWPPPFTP
jgi:hypothetical protein